MPCVFSILFSLAAVCMSVAGPREYGTPDTGAGNYPCWQEMALLTLTNACRVAPREYRDRFLNVSGILEPNAYPPVNPVHYNEELNRSARAHALDMARNCGLQHSSCDGTKWSARIRSYYQAGAGIAENIAYSRMMPQETLVQWLLDAVNQTPAADKSGNDGHRRNIMNGAYTEIGCGYATGPRGYRDSNNPYWVQDFGNGESAHQNHMISAASHLFLENDLITFMAVYHDRSNAPPATARCVVDGQAYKLEMTLGNGARGAYELHMPATSACRPYYFEFVNDNGIVERFPSDGVLVTFGEGDCRAWYSAGSSVRRAVSRKRDLANKDNARYRTIIPVAESMPRGGQWVIYDIRGKAVSGLNEKPLSAPAYGNGVYFLERACGRDRQR